MMKHLVLGISLVSSVAAADKATDPKLAQLVGRWEGTGNFTLNGKPFTYKVTYTCERAQVGPAITCALVAAGKDLHYEEAHLYGFDKATATYHLFSVNDWGESYDHASKWADADKVAFQFDGVQDGKPVREVYDIAFKTAELGVHG